MSKLSSAADGRMRADGEHTAPRLDYNEDPATRRVEPQPQPFDEEFDFGAGLATFDKRAVFQEIRVSLALGYSVSE